MSFNAVSLGLAALSSLGSAYTFRPDNANVTADVRPPLFPNHLGN